MSDQKPTETKPTSSDEIQVDELEQVAGGIDGEIAFDNTGCANALAKCG